MAIAVDVRSGDVTVPLTYDDAQQEKIAEGFRRDGAETDQSMLAREIDKFLIAKAYDKAGVSGSDTAYEDMDRIFKR